MIYASNLRKIYRSHGWANVVLDDVTFQLRPGQKLAVIGKNGAGKSTLIRLLGKVELPTSGTVDHQMSVSWPLGFTGAFQGSLTGIDNMRFISRVYGIDFEQMRAFVEDFSELGKFLYQPVKTYSSGMRARLAFALSLTIEFQCYLIDEVILVGDKRFHDRCREHLFDRRSDRALVLASHDAVFVQEVCDSGLVLSGGKAHYFEDIREAMKAYQELESSLKSNSGRQAAEVRPVDSSSAEGLASSVLPLASEKQASVLPNVQDIAASAGGVAANAGASECEGPSPEQLVDALYKHVLGRIPDPAGFASHVQRLKVNGLQNELPNWIRDFLNSEEAKTRLLPQNQQ